MINVKKFTTPILVLTGALCLTACALEEQVEPAEEAYTKAFIKEFGLIASDQDWNMATQGSVTVNAGSATNVKIYALVDGTYRLVGNYADVTGTQTLTFDIPKGVEDIRVENPTYSFKAKVGETVSFVGTRGMETSTDSNVKVEDDGEEDWNLTEADAKVYRDKLPEGKNNLKREGIVKDFYLEGVKELTIYPIYWRTSQKLTLGVYYENDEGNIVRVPVYTIKDTEKDKARLLVKPDAAAAVTYDAVSFTYTSKGVKGTNVNAIYEKILKETISQNSWQSGTLTDDEKTSITKTLSDAFGTRTGISYSFALSISKAADNDSYSWTENGKTKYGGKFTYTYTKNAVDENEDWTIFTDSKSESWSISDDFKGSICSKGIKITPKTGLKFGMYISYKDNEENDFYFYSQQDKNKDRECHAATYVDENTEVRYLGFEDWPNTDPDDNPSDFDLNDIIVRLDITTVEGTKDDGIKDEDAGSKTETAQGWIIACEDLGSTDDFDFNDIVFKVTHVSGETSVTITPLAAGGTLKAEIYWNGNSEAKYIGEIHELLGATATSSGSYPMINTTSITNVGEDIVKTDSKNIDGEKYSISNDNDKGQIGKFRIYVGGDSQSKTIITASKKGGAPQMFVVPDTWKWPKERVDIRDAYPKFKTWGSENKKKDFDWYTDRTGATGEVVER